MHVATSTHVLSLAKDHIYNLRKIGVAGDDSWLESRRGEAFDRHFQVKLKDNHLVLHFEDKNIGTIGLNNHIQVQYLIDFVEHWNRAIGPTDLRTTRTIELVKDWPQLLTKKLLRFKCVTWNCAGLLADTALKTETWIKLLGKEKVSTQDDVIVISFQETDNLNRSVKANTATLQSTIEVSRAYLHRTHTLKSTVQLLGLMTLVFVANPLVQYVSKVTTETSSTGFLRMWGNKGAVLTRFNLFSDEIIGGGLEVSIVNCHLSAGEGIAQLGRRRWELREIGQKFAIPGLTGKNDIPDYDRDPDETDSISSISSSEDDDQTFDEYVKPPIAAAKNRTTSLSSTSKDTIRETPHNDSGSDKEQMRSPQIASDSASSFPGDKGIPLRQDTGIPDNDGAATLGDETQNNDSSDSNSSSSPDDPFSTRPSKYTILMGDFNYRILLSRQDVQKKVKMEEWDGLLAHDSLSIERRQGIVFNGFEEAAIHFAPTYKYEIGTSKLAARVPSYTDRVMTRSGCPTNIIGYMSVPDLKSSDHKPVIFQGSVEPPNCIDPIEASKTLSRALKIADDAENNARPNLEIEEQQITLEGPPLTLQAHDIVLHNLGSRPIKWVIEDAQAHVEAIEEQDQSDAKAGASSASTNSDDTITNSQSTNSSNSSSALRIPLPNLREHGTELGNLFRARQGPDTTSLVTSNETTITPGHGTLSASRPTAKLQVVSRIAVEPRDFIALVTTQGDQDATLQKYVFIRIVPTKSYLGKPLKELPLDAKKIPIPIKSCIEYLGNLLNLEEMSQSMFSTIAEPSIFQMVLKWLDNDKKFDLEVLKVANETGNNAGIYAVAQVLVTIFRYLPNQLIGPNMRKKNAEYAHLVTYVCGFINKLKLDDEALDLWANVLYDRNDKKAGRIEKRAYLQSVLIIVDSQKNGKA